MNLDCQRLKEGLRLSCLESGYSASMWCDTCRRHAHTRACMQERYLAVKALFDKKPEIHVSNNEITAEDCAMFWALGVRVDDDMEHCVKELGDK